MKRSWVLAGALLGAAAAYAQPGNADQPSALPASTATKLTDDIEALQQEIVALRVQVDKIQSTLDIYINGMVAELQDENTRLRRLLRRTHADDPEAALAIPNPDQDLIVDALRNQEPAALAPAEEPVPPPPAEFTHTVVTEWGRSLEEAGKLGEGVQSLKGMIVAVPPGSTDEQLRQLAQDLRREFEDYNNINIEVFETIEAAKAFAAGDSTAGHSRVLSISKHAGSGRDTAVLIRRDRTEEVTLDVP